MFPDFSVSSRIRQKFSNLKTLLWYFCAGVTNTLFPGCFLFPSLSSFCYSWSSPWQSCPLVIIPPCEACLGTGYLLPYLPTRTPLKWVSVVIILDHLFHCLKNYFPSDFTLLNWSVFHSCHYLLLVSSYFIREFSFFWYLHLYHFVEVLILVVTFRCIYVQSDLY